MDKKKIKIFLGGFINYTNAQNLNCLSLVKHLDSSKFTTYALSVYFLPKIKSQAIIFNCFYPFRISSMIGFLWGVLKCNVIYLPKHHSTPRWILILSNLLGKKMFTTIESNMCDPEKKGMINSFGSQKNLTNHFKHITNIFGITQYIIDNANCGVSLKDKVLYLGVDIDIFRRKVRKVLRNIVFVGHLTESKRVEEFLQLAKQFPHINFNIIGDGINRESLKMQSTENVTFFGRLNQQELSSKFNEMDLLFLPSKSEGFPKVILETAACGIPSIVYHDYGAKEWLDNSHNGFIVDDFFDVIDTQNHKKFSNRLYFKPLQCLGHVACRCNRYQETLRLGRVPPNPKRWPAKRKNQGGGTQLVPDGPQKKTKKLARNLYQVARKRNQKQNV